MKRFVTAMAAVLTVAVTVSFADGVSAQSTAVTILSSNGVRAVVESLRAEMELAVGGPLAIEFSTAASLTRDIEAGRPFDVAILTPALIAELIMRQLVVANSRIDFARAGVGVGARADTGVRDVGTAEALKRTLLDAESVAFTADGQSRATVEKAFAALGIAAAMRPRTVLYGPGEAPLAVAAGKAELVLTLTSEILPVPGLVLVGPLPPEVQGYVSFAAGRSPAARNAQAAVALLSFLGGADFAAALATHGMESVER
jgi:molybdate transport system substrate-binding protein